MFKKKEEKPKKETPKAEKKTETKKTNPYAPGTQSHTAWIANNGG